MSSSFLTRFLLALWLALSAHGIAFAAGGSIAIERAPDKLNDLASLQRGAKLFMNYCTGCHSAAYMRYTRLTDLGLTEQQIKENLLFTGDKMGETIKTAMDPKDAKEWFGGLPPDLTVIARSRSGHGYSGADYLYTLLRSYYRDDSKATGWNNLAFPSIGMPHPLWELQGQREARFEKVKDAHGHESERFVEWQTLSAGKMSQLEYDAAVADLVNFLRWMGEPAQSQRARLGVWVLLFLALLIFMTWRLNAAFWRDVK
jgi:ubiquinol-cytochrome c reductase cytochrome c1 subunit